MKQSIIGLSLLLLVAVSASAQDRRDYGDRRDGNRYAASEHRRYDRDNHYRSRRHYEHHDRDMYRGGDHRYEH